MANQGDKRKKAIWFCKLLCRHPLISFGTFFFCQTLFIITTTILYSLGSDIFPVDFADVPLMLEDDPSYQRVMAWNLRNSDPNEPILPLFGDDELTRQEPADITELFYKTADGSNILTQRNLRTVLEFEDQMLASKHYEKFCVLRHNECRPPESLARLLAKFLTTNKTNSTEADATSLIQKAILQMYADHTSKESIMDFLDTNAIVSKDKVYATALRSYLYVSWAVHDINGSYYSTHKYSSDFLHPMLWKAAQRPGLGPGNMICFYYYSKFLYFDYLRYQVPRDLLFAIGSFCFISMFLIAQTQSLFISIFGVYGILTNFFGANLIYRYIFDYQYFGVFHILSIFIILGIGVDDIFVLNDAWRASQYGGYANIDLRFSDCYSKASRSMLITSVTTALAFFIIAFSPLLAVGSFGIFSGILIIVNYISVISYFASVIVVHGIYLQSGIANGCCSREKIKPGSMIEPIEGLSDNCIIDAFNNKEQPAFQHRQSSFVSTIMSKAATKYFSILLKKSVQAIILIVSLLIVAILAYYSSLMEIDDEPVKLFRHTHFLGQSRSLRESAFRPPYYETASDGATIYLIWGIRGIDRSHCHKTDWKECSPKIIWDDYFDLNPYLAQRSLLQFCRRLRSLSASQYDELYIRHTDSVPDIKCFIEDMDNFLSQQWIKEYAGNGHMIGGLPVTDVKVQSLMADLPQLYHIDTVRSNPYFSRFFETANLYWLSDGYSYLLRNGTIPPQAISSAGLLGHSVNSSDFYHRRYQDVNVVVGTRLRYAAILVNTTIKPYSMNYKVGLQALNRWELFFEKMKADMPAILHGGFVATPDKYETTLGAWHWFRVQETLSTSAIRGILLTSAIAFPLLIISTNDLLLGIIATLTIAITAISVIGIIPLVGWKLGVLESLNLTLVVGLAIDYIVHIAEGYHLATARTRKEKVRQVLNGIAVSVVSGAISTLGASLFMLFAQIVFFMEFGIFIFCTVAFSIIYSMTLFLVLLLIFGPQDDQTSIANCIRVLWKILRGFSSYFIDEDSEEDLSSGKPCLGNSIRTADDGSGDKELNHVHSASLVILDDRKGINYSTAPTTDVDGTNDGLSIANHSTSIDEDDRSSGYETGAAALEPYNDAAARDTPSSEVLRETPPSGESSDVEEMFVPRTSSSTNKRHSVDLTSRVRKKRSEVALDQPPEQNFAEKGNELPPVIKSENYAPGILPWSSRLPAHCSSGRPVSAVSGGSSTLTSEELNVEDLALVRSN